MTNFSKKRKNCLQPKDPPRGNLGEYAVSSRSDLRSANKYPAAFLFLLLFVAKTAKESIPKKHETEALKKTLRFEQQV